MPKGTKILSSIEIRALILEALAIENPEMTPRNSTFKMYEYRGTIDDLKAIVEHLDITHGLIDNVVEIPNAAWGAPEEMAQYQSNTNFNKEELDFFNEQIYFLVLQNVISPGAYWNYGNSLPYFHVTQYGLKCLEEQEILPYDPEKYLSRLQSFASIDDWELFYISQSLLCYNSGAIESSIIMLGLAGEYLAERMITNIGLFLQKNEPILRLQFDTALSGKTKISVRYKEYENILAHVVSLKDKSRIYKYPQLRGLSPYLDVAAKSIYATYLRLTRNELAHPACVQMDKIECLTMLVSFIKYSETQHKYLDFYISNS